MAKQDNLVQLETETAAERRSVLHAANGAPAGEPEVWSETVRAFNPHLNEVPEAYPVSVAPSFAEQAFEIGAYLAEERAKDLFRFSTAGSVDDGKSTLIGRLLYDTQSVYDDHIQSIEGKGTTAPGVLDLALLTDGLRAEREQGITIDVAYRYFSTPRRKFIIADTPGHEQYTRNMATGASTADAAIVLIDARKGVLPQSRRHAYITALLGVRHIVVAVNKMDLVGYAEPVFRRIEEDFRAFFGTLDIDRPEAIALHFVPVSALAGDNVVHATEAMGWYQGPSLLTLLETLPSAEQDTDSPFRFAVQRVIRPNLDFRGFAGQIASGTVRPGDRITVVPSGQSSRVKRIVTFDGDLEEAAAPLSVTLTLEDEIDISRGDVLVTPEAPAQVAAAFSAHLVWMDAAALDTGRRYLLKHMSRTVQAQVETLLSTVDVTTMSSTNAEGPKHGLALNGIGQVAVRTLQPLAVDAYASNRRSGSFVLIDPQTNGTVAAGMIRTVLEEGSKPHHAGAAGVDSLRAVSSEERARRYGHTGAHVAVSGDADFAEALERGLFARGGFVVRLAAEESAAAGPAVRSGALVLSDEGYGRRLRAMLVTDGERLELAVGDEMQSTVTDVLRQLQRMGVLQPGETR